MFCGFSHSASCKRADCCATLCSWCIHRKKQVLGCQSSAMPRARVKRSRPPVSSVLRGFLFLGPGQQKELLGIVLPPLGCALICYLPSLPRELARGCALVPWHTWASASGWNEICLTWVCAFSSFRGWLAGRWTYVCSSKALCFLNPHLSQEGVVASCLRTCQHEPPVPAPVERDPEQAAC